MYICMHQFSIITTNVRDFFRKYLSPSLLYRKMWLTRLQLIHIAAAAVFQLATATSTDQTLHWQFARNFLFHSAMLDVITKKHRTLSADSCTLHGRETYHQQLSSLNYVWFVKVRSGAATSPDTSFFFSAANHTVNSTVHKVCCRCDVFKCSTGCSTEFSSVSVE